MNEKNVKIAKRAHALKSFASSYNVKNFFFLNPGLQFKDSESAIKNKLKKFMSELKGFKFVKILVLDLKREKVI